MKMDLRKAKVLVVAGGNTANGGQYCARGDKNSTENKKEFSGQCDCACQDCAREA